MLSGQPESWFEIHESEDYYCEECLIYSPNKICSHHLSDHNFYAVCKVLFFFILAYTGLKRDICSWIGLHYSNYSIVLDLPHPLP